MIRTEFDIATITVNGRKIDKVVVDSHIRKQKDITDYVIIDLVRQLDGSEQCPDDKNGAFEYFVSLLFLGGKQFRQFGLWKLMRFT